MRRSSFSFKDYQRTQSFPGTPVFYPPSFHAPAPQKERTGTAPRIIDYAAPMRQRASHERTPAALTRPLLLREHRTDTLSQHLKRYFLLEEVELVMNKLSMFGLLFGLMFLGILFFLTGFLVAVNVYAQKPVQIPMISQGEGTSHMPSSNPAVNVAQGMPSPVGYRHGGAQYVPAPGFATVEGVPMIQQPRVPSHMQVHMVAPHPQAGQMVQASPSHHRPSPLPPVQMHGNNGPVVMPYPAPQHMVSTAQPNYNFVYAGE